MSLILKHQVPYGEFQVYSQKPDMAFTQVKQIHSDVIVDSISELSQCEADGIISYNDKNNNFNLCIVTADCVPLYVCGEKGYAMIHAGWRGLHHNIILNQKIKNLEPSFAYIGPHISQKNYQVTDDFLKYFPNSNCLEKDPQYKDRYKLSLKHEAIYQLKQLNSDIHIECSDICTYDHLELHSFRKDSTTSRNWNIFVYRE
jgi:polyphenol oxidase